MASDSQVNENNKLDKLMHMFEAAQKTALTEEKVEKSITSVISRLLPEAIKAEMAPVIAQQVKHDEAINDIRRQLQELKASQSQESPPLDNGRANMRFCPDQTPARSRPQSSGVAARSLKLGTLPR